MANSTCVGPIPLPPKKHQRSSSSGREPRESAVSASYNANKCDDHEYDEYCPGAYEPQTTHHQGRQSHISSSSSKHQQRSATFDVADARDYELKRLGNRRSQSQNASNLKQTRNGGLVVTNDHHRGERTHDRERSRSDHRIASYACDDTSLGMSHAFSGIMANGGISHHHSHHQQQIQQQQQQQHRQQQRREKTFKV
ncbi:hypothetical protein DOY81_000769 [Sarcophaga bullata]|nr:hypothetical protein DOY81_000769 [Sarcophaga bullata]